MASGHHCVRLIVIRELETRWWRDMLEGWSRNEEEVLSILYVKGGRKLGVQRLDAINDPEVILC